MEKRDRIYIILSGLITALCGYFFKLDYSSLAESGLTLSSIVFAVYIAAIIGLINTDLSKKMKKTVAPKQQSKSQLGVLITYFKSAIFCSIATIFLSSLILLLNKQNEPISSQLLLHIQYATSLLGLVFYVENLTFFAIITRFILNRQIWNE